LKKFIWTVPPGLEVNKRQKLILRKTNYAIVQGSRKFYKKLVEVLKVTGLIRSESDPCHWTNWDSNVENKFIIGIHIRKLLCNL
jgi:hypothetical protein